MAGTTSTYLGSSPLGQNPESSLSSMLFVLKDNLTGDITAKDFRDVIYTAFIDKGTIGKRSIIADNGIYSFAVGETNNASGSYSFATGIIVSATGSASFAHGNSTVASGENSMSSGFNAKATGYSANAQGIGTTASGSGSHAQGVGTKSTGVASHAEGLNTYSSASASHAEGSDTTASGHYSHSEGLGSVASGLASHAENNAYAISSYSHAGGVGAASNRYAEWSRGPRPGNQYGFVTHHGTTSNSTSTEIFCDGATQRFGLYPPTGVSGIIYKFDVQVMGVSSTGSCYIAKGEGVVKHDVVSGVISNSKAVSLSLYYSDGVMSGCSASYIVDNTLKVIKVTVNGPSVINIDWMVESKYMAVSY